MTTATHHQHQPPQPHLGFVVDTYDPDDVVPRGSPLMTPLRPKLEPSPSPPPDIPAAQVSLSPTSIDGRGKSNRHKVRPTSGDAVLVAYLDNGRDPDIAREAARESLPGDEDSPDEEPRRERAVDGNLMSGPLLQHLAADALQAASIATAPPSLAASVPKTIPDISIPTGQLSIHDEPPINGLSAPRYISGNRVTSPLISSSNGPLPPLHHGVRAPAGESKETLPSQSLPSLRSTFGELRDLHPERPSEQDLGRVPPGLSSTFPTSPAANLGHRFSLNTNLPSSPRSPPDGYRTLSPHSAPSANNLQRHVRVHHIDKDKDDPQLRDVLAQRPDGPNRGRRRRGPPA
ncbi:Transcriptional regulator prz1 [Fusarium acutatum]|uniref:Transcriptional regulator prz1 n=1 Tax=Fusarium acutatum TaxID=78861 RepID=A0A8H4JWE7_9HYPO|nr:Transcriptional regulator prz1 [Fusarium acutatum]